jgi:hypothetical protein
MRIFLILKEMWSKESSLPLNGAYLKMTLLSDRVFSYLKDISNLSSQHTNCTLSLVFKGCVIVSWNLASIYWLYDWIKKKLLGLKKSLIPWGISFHEKFQTQNFYTILSVLSYCLFYFSNSFGPKNTQIS